MVKAAFFDLDKTLYKGFLFYDWTVKLAESGLISFWELARLNKLLLLGVLRRTDYLVEAGNVAVEIGKILRDKEFSSIEERSKQVADSVTQRLYPYAKPLIKFFKDSGYKVILVSNEPDFVAELIKSDLNMDDALGLLYEIKEGKFTGVLQNDLYSQFGKARIIKEYSQTHDISLEDSFAMGDSEGDVEMLKIVGKGVLINTNNRLLDRLTKDTKIIKWNREELVERIVLVK